MRNDPKQLVIIHLLKPDGDLGHLWTGRLGAACFRIVTFAKELTPCDLWTALIITNSEFGFSSATVLLRMYQYRRVPRSFLHPRYRWQPLKHDGPDGPRNLTDAQRAVLAHLLPGGACTSTTAPPSEKTS